MRMKPLGRTGLFVSEICLGTMTFGGKGMFAKVGDLGQAEADALVRAAVDAGVNFIDTANVYSEGMSEEITGQSLRNLGLDRDEFVLATKVMGPMGPGPNSRGSSRKHIIEQAHASLRRLGTDYIDLYQIHGWDPAVPVEETVDALDSLVRAGHVRYVGVSNWAAWQVAKALGIADRRQAARFQSVQAYYTLAGRDLEREIGPMMASEGLGLMVWSPLAGGYLSGKYRSGAGEGRRAGFDFPPVDAARGDKVLDAMEPVAAAHGVSMAQVALAWLLQRPEVTSIIAGAKRPDQLADNLAATELRLSAEQVAALDAASALPREYPGWMIERQAEYRSGGMAGEPPRGGSR
jgi:aryl-alcohol dehydrogenase-like predicted oxidoreductase